MPNVSNGYDLIHLFAILGSHDNLCTLYTNRDLVREGAVDAAAPSDL